MTLNHWLLSIQIPSPAEARAMLLSTGHKLLFERTKDPWTLRVGHLHPSCHPSVNKRRQHCCDDVKKQPPVLPAGGTTGRRECSSGPDHHAAEEPATSSHVGGTAASSTAPPNYQAQKSLRRLQHLGQSMDTEPLGRKRTATRRAPSHLLPHDAQSLAAVHTNPLPRRSPSHAALDRPQVTF